MHIRLQGPLLLWVGSNHTTSKQLAAVIRPCIWLIHLCIHYSESKENEKLRNQTPNATSTLNSVDTKLSKKGLLPVTPPATPPATPPPAESPCVRVDGISASWSYESEKLVLSNISLEVNKVSLCDVMQQQCVGHSCAYICNVDLKCTMILLICTIV